MLAIGLVCQAFSLTWSRSQASACSASSHCLGSLVLKGMGIPVSISVQLPCTSLVVAKFAAQRLLGTSKPDVEAEAAQVGLLHKDRGLPSLCRILGI